MKYGFATFMACSLKLNGNKVTALALPWDEVLDNNLERMIFRKGSIQWGDMVIPVETNHDKQVVGYLSDLRQTDEGLAVEITLADTDRAREVKELIEQGILCGLSVGVDVLKEGRKWLFFGCTTIKKANLSEVSLVRRNAAFPEWKYA